MSKGIFPPKTAIITFGDSRDRVYERRYAIVVDQLGKISSSLKDHVEITLSESIRKVEDIARVLSMPQLQKAESVILHIPTWVLPNVVVMTANQIKRPLLVITNDLRDSAGMVGMLASAGGLDQVGLSHRRLVGDGLNSKIAKGLIAFCRAASVVARLKGKTYGLFGGRSLGMYTAIADPAQWQRQFGIDIEHIDQLEIIKRAEAVSEERIQKHLNWLETNIGLIEYDDKQRFTPVHLKKQIACYLATKDLIEENNFDFVGLKCQTELSDGYVLQCLSAALINDPYDADGSKKPIPLACEADCDGALTMMILHLLTQGQPTTLMDVKLFDTNPPLFAFGNCGGMATWFAANSDKPEENLAKVHLRPHIYGEAGGGATQYVAAPGEVTLARLCRKNGKYWMAIFSGEAVKREREDLRTVVWPWPYMFISAKIDVDDFLNTYGSNHMHVAKGNLVDELVMICGLLDIEAKVY